MSNILSDTDLSTIDSMIESFAKNKELELEIGFKYISYSTYVRVVKHLAEVTTAEIESSETLDAIILLENGDSFRTSFDGPVAQKFLTTASKQRASSDDLIKYVMNLKPGIAGVEQMFKNKNKAQMFTPENVNAVFKLTTEVPLSASVPKPTLTGREKILFRMKIRNTFKIGSDVKIDLTEVQQTNLHWKLNSVPTRYEIEIEATNRKIKSDNLVKEFINLLTVIQDSEIAIGKDEENRVLNTYKDLLSISYLKTLESRTMITMQVSHLLQHIPNRYACTDKADGERHDLIVLADGSVYLIDKSLKIKKMNMKVSDKKYVNMIIAGEYVDNENGKMFLIFDVIYVNEIDYRPANQKHILTERIAVINDVVKNCFKTFISFEDYASKNSDMEIEKIRKFYLKNLVPYYQEFRKKLSAVKGTFITRKLYFVPYGIDPSEVFMYADMIWKFSVYENHVPYALDGCVYTQINAPYMVRASGGDYDSVPLEYKWKDPKQNSIDFYIVFEKDKNGSDIVFYDESSAKGVNRSYKIARLMVGSKDGNTESPIPFIVNKVEQKAYIYAPDGTAQDSEEKPIDDKTVVEFIYDMNGAEGGSSVHTDSAYRWIPIRTRYDKTEIVGQTQTGYGNYKDVAYRIWMSIISPITDSVISILGNPSSYPKEIERLQELNVSEKSDRPVVDRKHAYYQKQTNIGSHMRAYHNWIKNNIIQSYCRNKKTVLDIGCGRGGDIQKFIAAQIGFYVGTDIDNHGLYGIEDCAACRYEGEKKRNPKISPMIFINVDSKALFDVKSQERAIKNMSDTNKNLIQTHLSGKKKYEVINCQFTLHYYLSDEISWNNFCKNVNDHLSSNGYFLMTTFDGKTIVEKLNGKKKLNISYTDNSGNKNVFAEIVKLYDDESMKNIMSNPYGHGIKVYNSTISDDPVEEYIVDYDFLIKSLKEKCNLDLIESDTFFNLFHLYKGYFGSKGGEKTNKQQKLIREFYQMLNPSFKDSYSAGDIESTKASFAFSSLNRYYIFKRKSGTKDLGNLDGGNVVRLNGKIELGKFVTPFLEKERMNIDLDNVHPRINPLYAKMKTMFGGKKPHVYLIRHRMIEANGELDNLVEIAKLKDGSNCTEMMLLYKSPDNHFYPIYREHKNQRQYVFSNDNVMNDLEILSHFTKNSK